MGNRFRKIDINDTSNSYMMVKTKDNTNPKGKRRVYFTCHPKDFELYFQKICNDIFKTQDCAIYYTKDMTAPIPEEYRKADLGQMSLFVVPVTYRLLTEPNRAMDDDLTFAMQESYSIPILPLQMEIYTENEGKELFNQEYAMHFGKRQYLSLHGNDLTEISYEEKLKKYLSSILVDDDTAKRVRKAFDAYIFLSYRKKDRQHANELMGLIHCNPLYRDIAIWYDEFLTPGVDFENDIKQAVDNSDLFALLVTPNLVNEENYVQATEYPYAHDKANKLILPAEMVETDKSQLSRQYPGITHCVDAHTKELDQAIFESIKAISLRSNDDDPEHCYLIGLAYIDGIDVEVNHEYGVQLITAAAEKDFPEAMITLYNMYFDGNVVDNDYNEALKWAKRLYNHYVKKEGKKADKTVDWLHKMSLAYYMLCDYKEAIKLCKKIYTLRRKELGEKDPKTIYALTNLAILYSKLGDLDKALEMFNIAYQRTCEIFGENNSETIRPLNDLAIIYSKLGDLDKELELNKKNYAVSCGAFGEEHPTTITILCNLAQSYFALGDYKKALELNNDVYELRCKVFGEKHPDTLASLYWLAQSYGYLGDYDKALELNKKAYALSCEVLSEKHPNTSSFNLLAATYGSLCEYNKEALDLQRKAYAESREKLGEKYPNALFAPNDSAAIVFNIGDYKKALELNNNVYELRCKTFGEKHPDTLLSLNNLAHSYVDLGEYKKALELFNNAYALRCEVLGEKHPDTLSTLHSLGLTYFKINDYNKALELHKKAYALRCEVLSEKHPDTLSSLHGLAYAYSKLGDNMNAALMFEKLYETLCGLDDDNKEWKIEVLSKLVYYYGKLGEREKLDKTRNILSKM